MGGRSSRAKGQRGERDLAHALRREFPGLEFKRGYQARGGHEQPDVMGLPGYHLESKFSDRPRPREALEQAIGDAKPGERPVVVIRQTRCEPYVVMRFADWADLVRRAEGHEGPLEPEEPEEPKELQAS